MDVLKNFITCKGIPVCAVISATCSRIVVNRGQIGWALCFKSFGAGGGAVIMFSFRNSCMLGRCSTTGVIPSDLSSVVYFWKH
jgi:hypothetical protein